MRRIGRSSAKQIRRGARRSAHGLTGTAAALAFFAVLSLASLLAVQPASAVPSFARQTGQPCAACHTAFPELTPFGRRFKLSGYTLQGGDSTLPPIAALLMQSFTHTQAAQDSPPQPGTRTNDNFVAQQVSGYYAGQIYGNLGGFIQVTGNPVTGQVFFDSSDVRYVDSFKLLGADTFWGIIVNNNPTVQDVWNTTPAFGFPEISSTLAPAFAPPLTRIETGFGLPAIEGAGAYVFWNDMLYAELSAYSGIPRSAEEALGYQPGPTPDVLNGATPYWRLALEPHWGDHYLMIGTFGMYGQIVPSSMFGFGYDDYTDIGFDSQYQYDGDKYSVTVKLTDIMEYQRLNSSAFQGFSSNLNDRLNSFKANASFVWDHTYSLSAGYFNISGTKDCDLYGVSCGASPGGLNSSPDGNGLIFDVAYLPFSHGSPWPYSTYNARIGIQYTKYLQLYGGANNFDGMIGTPGAGGTHNASGNNTWFLYAWVMF
jgi:hypothetical protein